MIEELLADAGTSLHQLDAIAFTVGPGSFTGVRIGASVVQGLAFAIDLPVIPLSSLAVLAQGAIQQSATELILPALDARMNQIYFGFYQVDQQQLVQPLQADVVINPSEIGIDIDVNLVNSVCAIGNGWSVYEDELSQCVKNIAPNILSQKFPHAIDALPLALNQWYNGKVVTAEQALPVYLRDKVVNNG
jgi:tRNA threonylcarbamoyladenosine biosynthesis protein TsaB